LFSFIANEEENLYTLVSSVFFIHTVAAVINHEIGLNIVRRRKTSLTKGSTYNKKGIFGKRFLKIFSRSGTTS
jgi:hypothetical protein